MKDKLLKIPEVRSWVTNRALSKQYSFDANLMKIYKTFVDFTMCQE